MDNPKVYCLFCILYMVVKLFEKLLVRGLWSHLADNNSLANNQYGLRSSRFTLQVIDKIRLVVKAANGRGYLYNRVVGILTLVVTNAFNMTPWDTILSAVRTMLVSDYLLN